MKNNIPSLENLLAELEKMPGIGPKSAQRLAFYILGLPEDEINKLSRAIVEAKKNTKYCSKCFFLTEENPCSYCQDESRDSSTLCIVALPKDIIAIEKANQYRGLYHVLGGLLSPLDGMGPEALRIRELMERIGKNNIKELILATSPTAEGETTVLYLSNLLKHTGLKITRLGMGLPMGLDVEYADEGTLVRAFENRKEI